MAQILAKCVFCGNQDGVFVETKEDAETYVCTRCQQVGPGDLHRVDHHLDQALKLDSQRASEEIMCEECSREFPYKVFLSSCICVRCTICNMPWRLCSCNEVSEQGKMAKSVAKTEDFRARQERKRLLAGPVEESIADLQNIGQPGYIHPIHGYMDDDPDETIDLDAEGD